MKLSFVINSLVLPFFILVNSLSLTAQKLNLQKSDKTVTVTCTFDNCSKVDSFTLFEITGLTQTPYAKGVVNGDGVVTFSFKQLSAPAFFALGVNDDVKRLKILILGTENTVKLTGPCFDMSAAEVKDSKINSNYDKAQARSNALKLQTYSLSNAYKTNYNDVAQRTANEAALKQCDVAKLAFLDSLKKENPILHKIISIDTYTSFQNDPQKIKYSDEIDYFGSAYFQHANLADTSYNHIPLLVGAVRNYASVITMPELQIDKKKQKTYFDAVLNKFSSKSNAYKFALSGVVLACMERNSSLLIPYGEQYLKDFTQDQSDFALSLSNTITTMRAQMIDMPAPEIAQTDTAGVVRKLSDLKGKYVLLDFWASWCGPCRKENPNVVNLYKKYHDKGFEVFSVSLDRDKAPWIKAIHDDGLLWSNHVSDLQYWSNAAARAYGVQSIPRTMLIDKQGVIIAQNLRGEDLANKIKELMGE